MNIGITGSTGFIGRKLNQKLQQNSSLKITQFDRKKYSLEKKESLKDFVRNLDVIIHLAGEVEDEKMFYQTNVIGTKNLLDAIVEFGNSTTSIILASSLGVYEGGSKNTLLSETTSKLLPTNHYGLSKLFADELVMFYSRRYGINASVLRISNVYGPFEKKVNRFFVNRAIDGIVHNKPVYINGDGNQARDFIFVDDVVNAIIMELNAKKNSSTINICTGQGTTLLEVIKELEMITNKKAMLIFNKSTKETTSWIGDPMKAKKILGFSAKISIEKGLRLTLSSINQTKKI